MLRESPLALLDMVAGRYATNMDMPNSSKRDRMYSNSKLYSGLVQRSELSRVALYSGYRDLLFILYHLGAGLQAYKNII